MRYRVKCKFQCEGVVIIDAKNPKDAANIFNNDFFAMMHASQRLPDEIVNFEFDPHPQKSIVSIRKSKWVHFADKIKRLNSENKTESPF